MRIVVLGGGPGGYQAAFEAARLGAEVALIEKAPEELGGTCLNWGCVPTKTILRTARIVHDVSRAERFALDAAPASVDVSRLRERKEAVVTDLRGQIASQAKRLGVEVVYGFGRMSSPNAVEVSGEDGTTMVEGDAVIIATGSKVFRLPGIDHDLPRVWTSDEAVSLTEIPARVLIIGGGIIGLEFACAYAAFGSEVTVVELMPTVMPGNDKRVTKAVQKALEGMGVTFHLGTKASSVEQDGETMRTTLESGETILTDVVLSAVGRMPNSEGMGFEEVGIEKDRAAVKVDEHFRTNVEGVYAIGDVIGGMMLAHVAEEEGVIAARNAVAELQTVGAEAKLETMRYDTVPACVYTFPEVAVVGSSRDSAKERGIDCVQAVVKFAANGKALAEGEGEGFVQMVAEKGTGAIIGCQIVGPHAVEIVHEVAVAMGCGSTVERLAHATHAHPTVSEVIKMAAAAAAAQC
ncbi:MAG: dihydrolipoyl dehydrogenase [Coriobacteriia bacterium]